MPYVTLDRFALVDCIGRGASQLLQGQITADIIALKPGKCCFFCLCNIKGRMIVNGLVIHSQPNAYHLVIMKPLEQKLIDALTPYAPFYDVDLKHSGHLIALDNQNGNIHLDWPEKITFSLVDGKQLCSDQNAQQKWFVEMMMHGIVFVDLHDSAAYLPSDTGWDGFGVSFSKGCYTGQEIVARVHYRGNPKRRFYIARLNEKPQGTDITDQHGKKCGSVVRILSSEDTSCIAACIDPSRIDQARIAGLRPKWQLVTGHAR